MFGSPASRLNRHRIPAANPSGGGTTNFLRADGSWAAPGNITGTLTTNQTVYANGTNAIASLGFPSSNGQVLTQNTTGAPFWSMPNSTNLHYINASSGGSTTLNNTDYFVIIDPGSTISSFSITMPPSPSVGQIIEINISLPILTLTFFGNTGQSTYGDPKFTNAFDRIVCIWYAPFNTWYIFPANLYLPIITSNTNFYVSTSGNDSNPGTSGSPWRTIQHAVNVVTKYCPANCNLSIILAVGTYSENVNLGVFDSTGFGQITITGDDFGTTPANYVISGTGIALNVLDTRLSAWHIGGLTLTSSGGDCIRVDGASILQVDSAIRFGAAGTGDSNHIRAQNDGLFKCTQAYVIAGGAGNAHMKAAKSGRIVINSGQTITASGTPAFANFVVAQNQGYVESSVTFGTGTASITGPRFYVDTQAQINTSNAGVSYFPGNSAGMIGPDYGVYS